MNNPTWDFTLFEDEINNITLVYEPFSSKKTIDEIWKTTKTQNQSTQTRKRNRQSKKCKNVMTKTFADAVRPLKN